MKLKKYNNYLNEDKNDDDDFFGEYGSQDDYEGQDDAQGDDDMEHLLYLLRTFLKDSGINNVSLKNSTDSIKLEIVLKTKERLADVIKTFAVLKKLSNDIMADYDAEFDIWETKQGDPLLIVDYYSPEYDDDEDGAPF
jgi:hypothetical protein